MRLSFSVLVAALLSASAVAEDRAELKPVTMNGNWFANPSAAPSGCSGDGWVMQFSAGTKKVSVSVTQRTGTTYSTPVTTVYEIATPPEGAPAKIGLFLKGPKSEAGVALLNNMQAEWIPAGADSSYSVTGMHLRRC